MSNMVFVPMDELQSRPVTESRLKGAFTGLGSRKLFELTNGQVWQQVSNTYRYRYAYMPRVAVLNYGGGYALWVEGMPAAVRVRRLR